jgi:hypothetical protein
MRNSTSKYNDAKKLQPHGVEIGPDSTAPYILLGEVGASLAAR